MGRIRPLLALLGLLGAARARAAQPYDGVYSYKDSDGVYHFSNAPSETQYRPVIREYRRNGVTYVTIGPRSRGGVEKARLVFSSAAAKIYEPLIAAAADKYRLAPALIKAVMSVESAGNRYAQSDKGAMGLMQLMPGTARDMAVRDAWDPGQNIEGGARYLRQMLDLHGQDLEKALAAYNAGPQAVRRSGGAVPAIRETQEYVRRVREHYDHFIAER
ncbi:lytic transglycosylase domain-containing protein [Anaeromyxobacter paludicola]|uniref:Lytic transglycosylase n=1 Tax=Anaeromyxobacter paludicola TaxID=2918171 RepID=A0ABM7XAH5_9BACT|nr:lytic transglycosylase domain-containing protein [Anaeromyxobacter paludicola]BDG08859.1 lytic transglycosylase [Anaeromyxobacter paludicola]